MMQTGRRVVIIEDDPDVQSLLGLVVTGLAAAEVVGIAGDVARGKVLLDSVGADAALIDLGLPDGPGSDLLAVCPQTRKVVLSAQAVTDRAGLLALGAHAVLIKPCPPQEIAEALHRALASRN